MHDDPIPDVPRIPRRVLARASANLREARERAGLTQEQLAERSELDLAEIERLEHGAALPHLDTLVRLAAALEVPPAELCEGIVWDPERRRFE